MKKLVVVSLIVLLIAFIGSYSVSATYSPKAVAATSAPVGTPTKEGLLRFTNAARAKNGLPPLVEDSRLDQSAQIKADDMTKYNYFGHVRDGVHGYSYVYETYPDCPIPSENVIDSSSSQAAVIGFMGSKGHREAILNSKNIAVGFGISGYHIVQHFCVMQ